MVDGWGLRLVMTLPQLAGWRLTKRIEKGKQGKPLHPPRRRATEISPVRYLTLPSPTSNPKLGYRSLGGFFCLCGAVLWSVDDGCWWLEVGTEGSCVMGGKWLNEAGECKSSGLFVQCLPSTSPSLLPGKTETTWWFEFKERLESQQVSPRCTRSVWCSSLGGVSDHISLPLEISLTLSSMPQ